VKKRAEFDGVHWWHRVAIVAENLDRLRMGHPDAYEPSSAGMIARSTPARRFKGHLLCLHGAMAVRACLARAELARRVRQAVGPGVVIAATFDLHGQ